MEIKDRNGITHLDIINTYFKGKLNENGKLYVIRQLELIAAYYAGEFEEYKHNLEFKRIKYKLFLNAFYSTIYLNYIDNKFILLRKVKDKYQDIETNKFYKFKEEELVKFDYNIPNLFANWMWLLSREYELLKIWDNNMILDIKKLKVLHNSKNKQITDQLVGSITDNNTPFIEMYSMFTNGEVDSEIEELNIQSNTQQAYINLMNNFKYYADRLGYVVSQETKRERLTTAEGLINVHNSNNLLRNVLEGLEVMAFDINRLWGVEIEFTRPEEYVQNLDSSLGIDEVIVGGTGSHA